MLLFYRYVKSWHAVIWLSGLKPFQEGEETVSLDRNALLMPECSHGMLATHNDSKGDGGGLSRKDRLATPKLPEWLGSIDCISPTSNKPACDMGSIP